MNHSRIKRTTAVFSLLLLFLGGCSFAREQPGEPGAPSASAQTATASTHASSSLSAEELLDAYDGSSVVTVNGNAPSFSDAQLTEDSFEAYSELDALGRCQSATANIGTDLMPDAPREAIGDIRPSGWQTVKYNGLIDGNYLYNRCHLIGFQLAGENANPQNLITGTRWMNTEGMLPFEDAIADYVRDTGNHVLYRVTPVYEGDNLVASGVEMEAESVEDGGAAICFHVFAYNIQPGISIDYKNGDSQVDTDYESEMETAQEKQVVLEERIEEIVSGEVSDVESLPKASDISTYVLNTNTKKFHLPDCDSVPQIAERNKKEYTGSRQALLNEGYEPCGSCHP